MKNRFETVDQNDIRQMFNEALGRRNIVEGVIHCSATKEGENFTAEDMHKMHLNRGFNQIGYNLVFLLDGTIQMGRDWSLVPAHVKGNNRSTLGFAYIGGLDSNGKAKDTRTDAQKESMLNTILTINAETIFKSGSEFDFKGHRDYSPDLDGDGIIEPFEWTKQCPCFDVADWLKEEHLKSK